MLVSPTSAGNYGLAYGYNAGGDSEIDQVDFMQLLITQIRHQDPFDPLDNSEMVSQLNQFSMLDQMNDLNGKTENLLLMNQALNNTMMLDLVGRNVTVEGDQVEFQTAVDADGLPEGTPFRFVTEVGGSATLTLKDAGGVVRATFVVPAVAGVNEVDWSALIQSSEYDLDGGYTVEVAATSADGTAVPATTYMTLPVDSIRYEDGVGVVEVGGREFYVSEIYRVGA